MAKGGPHLGHVLEFAVSGQAVEFGEDIARCLVVLGAAPQRRPISRQRRQPDKAGQAAALLHVVGGLALGIDDDHTAAHQQLADVLADLGHDVNDGVGPGFDPVELAADGRVVAVRVPTEQRGSWKVPSDVSTAERESIVRARLAANNGEKGTVAGRNPR